MKLLLQSFFLVAVALAVGVAASHGQSVLLAGFDGNQTYTPGGTFQSEGDKSITNPVRSTAAVTAGFTAELYMFNDVAKEMQWGGAGQVSSGAWGSGAEGPFTPAPSTANNTNIYTVTIASTLEFRVENTGTDNISLEHIYFAALPGGSGVSQMTVSYASGALTALGGGSANVTLTSTSNLGYDVDLTSILSDNVLGAGESAVFTLVTSAGSDRFRVDDIGISGTIESEPAGPVDAGNSTVVASPTSVPANGSTTSTITVTLKDASGTPVTGEGVTLTNSSGPGAATINPSGAQTTNGSGVATFTVSSSTEGTEVFTATSSTAGTVISQTASVEFTAVPVVDAGTSTVVASPASVTADGSSTSTITVTLKDASGTLITGEDVTLTNTSGSGTPTISPSSTQTTNGSGVATFTVSSSTVDTEVFAATSSTDSVTITQTASVEFTAIPVAGPVDAGNSTVVASPTSVDADGSEVSIITVTLKDASGLAVESEDVTLANTSGPGSPTITPSNAQATNSSGVATFSVSSSTAGTEVFTATSSTDNVVITQTASVEFVEVGSAFLVALLSDPVAATSSASETSSVENFYDGNETVDDVGTTNSRGNSYVASGVDSDGVDGTSAHTVVYDMGTVVSFDGFVHAQRKGDGFDDVASIDFWVTNTDPGDAATAVPLPFFAAQPIPDDSVTLERNSAVLNEYLLPGGTISGRYVVMRLHTARTSGANPGGYTLQLGQTASVSDYDTWGSAYPGIGLPSEDDDLDGLSNKKEWLFGLNPKDAGSANPFSAAFDAAAGTFSYTRRTQSLTGMTYKVLYSTDLEEWLWESGASESAGAPVNNVETVAVTIAPGLLDEPKLFLRISSEDLGPPPVITSLWGSNTSVTIIFSEDMSGSSVTTPANYTLEEDGGNTITVSGVVLSANGKTATLTLASALSIDSAFTVTTNRIANSAGQPLGNGTAGQFRTWDNDPNGIKVFILAGQSNMVGYGHSESGLGGVDGAIGSLRYLAQPVNNATYTEYDYTSLLETPTDPANSAWATRSDVKVWWKNGVSGNLDGPLGKGDLGPPFRGANTNWFGPEYGFGQVIGDFYASDDVLIIKAAWGGHKLVSDFRSPSAVAARGGEVGASYLEIFNDAREVLLDLDNQFPEWAGRGYQIVGFGWHQGTSDKAPEEVANEYKDNLPDFISDVRAEFAKPGLPFVIATAGMQQSGLVEDAPYTGYTEVERAQLWVAGVAQPANVRSTDTRGFHEDASDSPSTQSFHWNHNARSYFRIGLGLGDDMVNLLSE